jgi:FkbM family methyltransferase
MELSGMAPLSSWVRLRRTGLHTLEAAIAGELRRGGLVEIATHTAYAPPLGPRSVVIDAGAHVGEFAAAIRDRFGARVFALEPVPELRARIAQVPGLSVLDGALAGTDGEIELHLSANPQANSADPRIAEQFGYRGTIRVRSWSLAGLMAELTLTGIDLLKLDVEGAELEVLETASAATLGAIDQITVEFHDFLGGPDVAARVRTICRRLTGFGFRVMVLSAPWGNHTDVLFLGPRVKVSRRARYHQALLAGLALPLRGLIHRLRRGSA